MTNEKYIKTVMNKNIEIQDYLNLECPMVYIDGFYGSVYGVNRHYSHNGFEIRIVNRDKDEYKICSLAHLQTFLDMIDHATPKTKLFKIAVS